MKPPKDIIRQAWDEFQEAEPDISTERLFAMTQEATWATADEVAEALSEEEHENGHD